MPLVTTAELVTNAYRRGAGLAAYNVITLEHAEAVIDGAEQVREPVVLQVSENAIRFHGGHVEPILAALAAAARLSAVCVSIHLDHIESVELMHCAYRAGASSVMFDASRLEYQANVAATRAAVNWAHQRGLFVEAELGEIGGKRGAHVDGVRTDPREAADFVAATGVDAIAVAVGSSHAMATRTATLDFDLISRLHDAVPIPLVLHGSSGVADGDIRRAIQAGMTKINVGTILNVAFTAAVRARLASDDDVVDPRTYLSPARAAASRTVAALTATISSSPRNIACQ